MYDTESFIKDVEILFKANLNAELLLIDTEKGDYILNPINENAWYLHNLQEEVFSYSHFVLISMRSNVSVSEPSEYSYNKEVMLDIEICMPDEGDDDVTNIFWQLLRYTRALETIVFKNFDSFQGITKLKVNSLIPAEYPFKGKLIRSAGVSVSAKMAS